MPKQTTSDLLTGLADFLQAHPELNIMDKYIDALREAAEKCKGQTEAYNGK